MKFFERLTTKIKNFFLCLKYPFMKARNVWTDRFCGYSFTWYDDIPIGWQKAFGKKLCDDLKAALKKDKCMKTFRFEQIKEKYGTLRLYAHGFGDESDRVLTYYEKLSENYCINCGKPAEYVTDGWIEYYCWDCFSDILDNMPENARLEYIDKCRIDKK